MMKGETANGLHDRFQRGAQGQKGRILYPYIPVQLNPEENLEVNGNRCRREEMVSMSDVLDNLRENGASFTALEPIREKYTGCFGDDLCWTYPLGLENHMGCVILFVREGAMYLPYDSVDAETYEQFDLEAVELLTAAKAQDLVAALFTQAAELYSVLLDVCRFLPLASPAHDSVVTEEGC